MAALHVLSPLGLAFLRPRHLSSRARRIHVLIPFALSAVVSMALWTAIARSRRCLWVLATLGFSLLVLVGLFLR